MYITKPINKKESSRIGLNLKQPSKFNKNYAFTIVELLVVIVVIGILAAITIVSYMGISQRATVTSLTSDLTNAVTQLKLDQVTNSAYPTNLAAANGGKGIPASSGTSYQYSYNNNSNPQTFCITATKGTTSYEITNDSVPTIGGCPGHGVGGIPPITNLVTNPSFENDLSGVFTSLTTLNRITSGGIKGSSYLSAARTAVGDSYFGFTLSPNAPLSTTYTLSFWIWADSTVTLSSDLLFRHHMSTGGDYNLSNISNQQVTSTPVRIIMSGTTSPSDSTGGLQFIGRLPASIGVPVYYDGFMITQGSTTYNYADGNSANWIWNGTSNNSTSTGPQL